MLQRIHRGRGGALRSTDGAAALKKRPARLDFEKRVLLLALAAGLPGVAGTALVLWATGASARTQWTVDLVLVSLWLSFAFAVQGAIIKPLRTMSNLLAALREEDFSFRARGTRGEDALALAMSEVNALADTLREQRLGALEATALLRKVMEEIEAAVFAFDGAHRLQLVNRAGERLLAQPAERLMGREADELGLGAALSAGIREVLDLTFPGRSGRWEVSRGTFRQHGVPHVLLVLTDLSRALREEERQAWQRLIRVLSHELNNSLAPIRSIAGSLEQLLGRAPRPADWEDDTRRGLAVIGSRAESLTRFMEAYGTLARLPAPRFQPVAIEALVHRVSGLEARVPIEVRSGLSTEIHADPDQIEQLLINLLRNAAEAALETGGSKVEVSWHVPAGGALEVRVEDRGPGLSDTANLFVPFFTTKPKGSGIGLVLSRQIAEAHGGSLVLENRPGGGCRARLVLPRGAPSAAAG